MNTEETNVDVEDAQTISVEQKDALDAAQVAVDADATEADVSEADLDQEEQEKQPMTAGGDRPAVAPPEVREEVGAEKNGSVKLKVLDEAEEKFTGLNKEELLRVAGTPG
ncbi:hypothetical protein ILYODFUR_032223 [Ilyodon furcidens]|uniref:Uncharacterized protein n=2 Tax=Goodeidae TaxID=28758 RepID=A0ABV0SQW5_9TELE